MLDAYSEQRIKQLHGDMDILTQEVNHFNQSKIMGNQTERSMPADYGKINPENDLESYKAKEREKEQKREQER